MITIPSGEFTGLLSDVVPFASTDLEHKDLSCVRVDWDGHVLHALATDRFRVGWSRWSPEDPPDGDVQEDLFAQWGGADDPWSVTVHLAEAKELVKCFKLPGKQWFVPLTVDMDRKRGRLKVVRSRDTGHSAITAVLDDSGATFPDVRQLMAAKAGAAPVEELAFTAKLLAAFAKVRPRGPLRLRFTGEESMAHVSIGDGFTGAIMPVRAASEAAAEREDA